MSNNNNNNSDTTKGNKKEKDKSGSYLEWQKLCLQIENEVSPDWLRIFSMEEEPSLKGFSDQWWSSSSLSVSIELPNDNTIITDNYQGSYNEKTEIIKRFLKTWK